MNLATHKQRRQYAIEQFQEELANLQGLKEAYNEARYMRDLCFQDNNVNAAWIFIYMIRDLQEKIRNQKTLTNETYNIKEELCKN